MRKTCACVCLLLFLSACGNRYGKLDALSGTGYEQSDLGYGAFVVSYRSPDMEFCKKAAFYRAAEICHQLGSRYFKVTDGQVLSDFLQHSPSADMPGNQDPSSTSLGNTAAGLNKVADVGYSYKIELIKAVPPRRLAGENPAAFNAAALKDTFHDASEILSTWPVPGSNPKK